MKFRLRPLIQKEFLAVWRDKRTRSVLILPPLMQLLLFSFAATLEVKNISVGIYNQDTGPQSIELIQRITGSKKFTDVQYVEGIPPMETLIDEKKTLVGIHIPENFSNTIEQRESASLQVLLDGRRSNASSIVLGYINDIVEAYNRELATQFKMPLPTINLIPHNWFNKNLEYTWFTIPSLVAILSMLIALVLTALSVAREREMGTFEQLLVAPLTPGEILIGKTIPPLLLAIAEGSLILVLAIVLFGIKFQGNFLLLYTSMVIFLLAVVGFGLFISSLCMTQQQAVLGTFLFMNPAVILSGFATPVENMPLWLQHLSSVIPLKHFLIIIKGLFLKDFSADLVLKHTFPNALIALFTLSAATWFFKRRME